MSISTTDLSAQMVVIAAQVASLARIAEQQTREIAGLRAELRSTLRQYERVVYQAITRAGGHTTIAAEGGLPPAQRLGEGTAAMISAD